MVLGQQEFNMKTALVCIAKNEENYIQEWIDYHLKLGFDDIIIYQNNWRWSGETKNVIKIDFDGNTKQIPAYNHFINENVNRYDWVAFFDVDEFLVLKKHKNINEFLKDYSDYPAIGINWVLFGDNGHNKINGEYSVLKRFTKRQNSVNDHVKCIVKLNKPFLMGVHTPDFISWVDTNKNYNNGNFNQNGDYEIAQINHYFCKTEEEFKLKCERGRSDIQSLRTMVEFEPHNINEIEDLTAFKFMYE
jgi:hypothetical protein